MSDAEYDSEGGESWHPSQDSPGGSSGAGSQRSKNSQMLPPIDKPNYAAMTRSRSDAVVGQHHAHRNILIQERLYLGEDPFKNLSSVWLAGGPKGEIVENEEEESEEEEEEYDEDGNLTMSDERREKLQAAAQKKAAEEQFKEDEERRVRQLATDAMGHVRWLRGRKMRSDFLLVKDAENRKHQLAQARALRKPPERVYASTGAEPWYKALMPSTGKVWCWRENFVNEVKFIAEGHKLPLPFMTVSAARRIYQKNPGFRQAVRNHVVCVTSSGERWLWSQAFVQTLEVVHTSQGYADGEMRCTLEQLQNRFPEIDFPVPGKYSQSQKVEAERLPVPDFMQSQHLEKGGRVPIGTKRPPAPPLPERLPARIPYNLDAPWAGILATKEEQQKLTRQRTARLAAEQKKKDARLQREEEERRRLEAERRAMAEENDEGEEEEEVELDMPVDLSSPDNASKGRSSVSNTPKLRSSVSFVDEELERHRRRSYLES